VEARGNQSAAERHRAIIFRIHRAGWDEARVHARRHRVHAGDARNFLDEIGLAGEVLAVGRHLPAALRRTQAKAGEDFRDALLADRDAEQCLDARWPAAAPCA